MSQKGFTLMEIIVAMIILSVMAAISIPYYTTVMSQSKARAAQNNLTIIYNAQKNYYFANGTYYSSAAYPSPDPNLNTNLGVNIVDNYFQYTCTGTSTTFSCTATLASPAVSLTVNNNPLVLTGGTGCLTAGPAPCNPVCNSAPSIYCPN